MKRRSDQALGVILATIAFLVSPLFVGAQSVPDFPMAFWGNATINGATAPVGSVVRAYYGSQLAGIVTIQQTNGIYGENNPTKQRLVVGQGTGPLTFSIQSSSVNGGQEIFLTPTPAIYFSSGSEVPENFAFSYSVQSGGGGSSTSGGGGGGGGVSSVNAPTATTSVNQTYGINTFNLLMVYWGTNNTAADLNGDGIVDVLDFNTLMVHWSA
jgi:hypothetical protein